MGFGDEFDCVAISATEKLKEFLPNPKIKFDDGEYFLDKKNKNSIGSVPIVNFDEINKLYYLVKSISG